MKTALKGIVLGVCALVGSAAMAAPGPDYRDHGHKAPPPPPMMHKADRSSHKAPPRPSHMQPKPAHMQGFKPSQHRVDPSRDWRVGQLLPRQFDSRHFQVSSSASKKLHKAAKNQQWYKVNGDYVLVNEKNHKIVKIVR